MPAKCGWSALKARLARELLPWKGWRISEGNSSRPCVCASRINFAAERQGRRRRTSESMFGLFLRATWQILPVSGCAQDRAGVKSRKDAFSLSYLRKTEVFCTKSEDFFWNEKRLRSAIFPLQRQTKGSMGEWSKPAHC